MQGQGSEGRGGVHSTVPYFDEPLIGLLFNALHSVSAQASMHVSLSPVALCAVKAEAEAETVAVVVVVAADGGSSSKRLATAKCLSKVAQDRGPN